MREDDVRAAIVALPDKPFEDFANEILRRELYPGLNPTSDSHDLGEDAHSEWSTLHDGKWVSVFASKTTTWGKVKHDCERCKSTGRTIDVVVFATSGHPRRDIEERWRERVEQEFGWRLEVRTINWLAPVASAPQHESLVDDYLNIPPPGGDYVQSIEERFEYYTQKARQRIHTHIPGVADPLPRREVPWIEEQLLQGKSVLLTGDAGTGKSGIAAQLTDSAQASGLVVLLLDARRVGSCQTEVQIRQYLGLNGPVASAIQRMGRYKGCRVIIDQLDSAAGLPAAKLLAELAEDVSGHEGVEVIAISRKNEKHESRMTHELSKAGFVELTSYPMGESEAAEVLSGLGIPDCTPELVALATNLLNLELIGDIKESQPDMDFGVLTDEIDLWDRYFATLQDREESEAGSESAEVILAEARRLAWTGLISEDGMICIDDPMLHSQRRLVSWGIIEREDGQVYRFRHERLQDFLCAWDAVEKLWMPGSVVAKVGEHRSSHVLTWMDKLYYRRHPTRRKQFLKEIYNV